MSDSEEEMLVVVEFNHTLPPLNDQCTFKVVGLETDNPVVQYQKQVFRGEWQDCTGTKCLFTEKKSAEAVDPVFSPIIPKMYDYVDKTSKVLQLRPFVLNVKTDSLEEGDADEDSDRDEDDPGVSCEGNME